ncbi:uncharacterized protein EV420DRAFT_220046 [Desarmillaria tabescens]|uniref:Uncharacterized protein n=1 Tax=Armillaria tabescens TaxID=1929756 RepID=A0AA39N7T0_ARMTA|nr:uncharacterized protein EV420DRAFT_220046 [Desarmillaria tabescens]KAK0460611.1 hypothetical protein EV420DRAFT_220046 [Desarmillaria tabescens]
MMDRFHPILVCVILIVTLDYWYHSHWNVPLLHSSVSLANHFISETRPSRLDRASCTTLPTGSMNTDPRCSCAYPKQVYTSNRSRNSSHSARSQQCISE